jgi:hypothetical protein
MYHLLKIDLNVEALECTSLPQIKELMLILVLDFY